METLTNNKNDENSLQLLFIDNIIKTKINVSIYFTHGIHLIGKIVEQDLDTLILIKDNQYQLIFKRHIASILPKS